MTADATGAAHAMGMADATTAAGAAVPAAPGIPRTPTTPAPAAGTPHPAYWAEAQAADLVVRHAGHRLVVGSSTDPLSGERGLLVEYADPAALTDGTLEAVLADRSARSPGTASVQVRTPADVTLGSPWRRSVTYIALTGPLPERPRPDGLRVGAAGEEHRAAVREWTARAIRQGAREQGREVAEDAIAATADEVLADPGATVLVAVLNGRPVGHAVLLADQADAVTGAIRTELWDVLVEPEAPHAAACRDALVRAAADLAATLGLPLVGHVVHRAEETESRALASLLTRGWRTDHAYWTTTPAELPGTPSATSIGIPL